MPRGLRICAILSGAASIAFVGLSLFGERGVLRTERLRDEHARLCAVNDELAQENARLKAQVRALKEDDAYIESVVRDELGWVRPDELVFTFRGLSRGSPPVRRPAKVNTNGER